MHMFSTGKRSRIRRFMLLVAAWTAASLVIQFLVGNNIHNEKTIYTGKNQYIVRTENLTINLCQFIDSFKYPQFPHKLQLISIVSGLQVRIEQIRKYIRYLHKFVAGRVKVAH